MPATIQNLCIRAYCSLLGKEMPWHAEAREEAEAEAEGAAEGPERHWLEYEPGPKALQLTSEAPAEGDCGEEPCSPVSADVTLDEDHVEQVTPPESPVQPASPLSEDGSQSSGDNEDNPLAPGGSGAPRHVFDGRR